MEPGVRQDQRCSRRYRQIVIPEIHVKIQLKSGSELYSSRYQQIVIPEIHIKI